MKIIKINAPFSYVSFVNQQNKSYIPIFGFEEYNLEELNNIRSVSICEGDNITNLNYYPKKKFIKIGPKDFCLKFNAKNGKHYITNLLINSNIKINAINSSRLFINNYINKNSIFNIEGFPLISSYGYDDSSFWVDGNYRFGRKKFKDKKFIRAEPRSNIFEDFRYKLYDEKELLIEEIIQ